MPLTINEVQTYTVAEASQAAQRTPKTIFRAIHNGKLKASRVGWTFLITRPDLQAYVDTYINRNVTLP